MFYLLYLMYNGNLFKKYRNSLVRSYIVKGYII